MPAIQFLVEKRESGWTVAEMLRKRFTLTWTQAKRIVENGHVRVAGQLTRAPEQRIKAGNRVWIAAGAIEVKTVKGPKIPGAPELSKANAKAKHKPDPTKKPKAEMLPPNPFLSKIELVYVDDSIAVVNKPADLTTTRTADETAEFGARAKKFLPKTLADLMPLVLGMPNRKVFAVHRLDRDTTGLIVFARKATVATNLAAQFRKHTIDRRYVALTRGIPEEGRVESVFVKDRGDGRRGSTTETKPVGGQKAITRIKVLDELGDSAMIECRLETGRTHQVRIHLGEAGAPLCGERIYDRPMGGIPMPDASGAARPMLHAAHLGLLHPETEEFVSWNADPPADFATLLKTLKDKAEPKRTARG